ncbi:NADP-dependent alcohol dehydrogenase [Rhodocollybia butyracea]|uniref:NADP-dependent alcohol dehydrogenase n=1 Tax=Rhodocollybia butyracea TaxID=206335 RepID=A0A9P5U1Q0_9AGAR|nr:NADP-dependent alcohol dehydrogenase [Rhodocollybia butyracea]
MGFESIQLRRSPSGKIVQKAFVHPELDADEVAIKITHSGLCYTDVHYSTTDMVLGHEDIGIIHSVGSNVSSVKPGDRVGWGYPNKTCQRCDLCLRGEDNFCADKQFFGEADFDQGSLETITMHKEQWLFKVPEGLSSEDAAPLMCGGSTVWTPLVNHVKPYHRVGIVGISGLGHLAIQFASKMGADVVVFSASESKRVEALQLGANEFYATKGVADYTKLGVTKPIDRLIISSSAKVDLSLFYPFLSKQAMITPLSIGEGDLTVPYGPTVLQGMQVSGSIIALRFMQSKALEFAARNGIHVVVERFSMTLEGANAALAKLKEGKMRYRAVLFKD